MPPQCRTPCALNTRRTSGRTPAPPQARMTPSVTCDGVSGTSHVPKAAEPERCRTFQKNLQFPPQARTKAGSRRFDVSQATFLSSEATKRQPRPEYERRTYSRKRNRMSGAITARKADVIFAPTGGAERDGRLSAGGRNRHSSREHGKAPVKTPPAAQGCSRPMPTRPPSGRRSLSVSAPSASALFLRASRPPRMSQDRSQSPPTHASPPVSETRSASGPATPADSGCPRLSPRTPLSQAAQKKAPFPKRKEGPGLRPKLADARLTLRDRSLRGSRRWCTRSARRRVLPARR